MKFKKGEIIGKDWIYLPKQGAYPDCYINLNRIVQIYIREEYDNRSMQIIFANNHYQIVPNTCRQWQDIILQAIKFRLDVEIKAIP